MSGHRRSGHVWPAVLMVAWAALFRALTTGPETGAGLPGAPAAGERDTQEVGVVGDDLPFWRAREAVRHAEVKLGGQTVAMQALEGRATSMIGWSVAVLLALGAAIASGAHAMAASAAALCLIAAAILSVTGIVFREFGGVPGYEPAILLNDHSASEFEVLVALAEGYQSAIDRNHAAFRHFRRLLTAAIVLMILSPATGFAVLLLSPATPDCSRPPIIRAASALAECAAEFRFWECGSNAESS